MRELSLNVLDIAQNSISAGAALIEISVEEETAGQRLTIVIADNGKGMNGEQVKRVLDPFYTTRTTRKVGMGIPLFRMAALQCGGSFDITSEPGRGTRVTAVFDTGSIDFTPLGDMAGTLVALISMNEDRRFLYRHACDGKSFTLDTEEIKGILDGVPLSEPGIQVWMREYITEQTEELTRKEGSDL